MEEQNHRHIELARKWLNGTVTEEEKKEFAQWYDQESTAPLPVPLSFALSETELQKRMLARILKEKDGNGTVRMKRKPSPTFAAATLFLLAGSAFFYGINRSRNEVAHGNNQSANATQNAAPQADIAPGGNKAVLLLADGSRVVLDTASTGTIAADQSTRVVKLTDGRVAFSSAGGAAAVGYNTLSTPYGGQYAITLSDGSAVWLNAGSSLRFPSVFTGAERVVELSGEAYFEVAKNSRLPFLVKVNGMELKVLGTRFNVMAYEDEDAIQTTLLEGSVRIQKDGATALLKPGQQAAIKPAGAISVRDDADAEQVLAWKTGFFNFKGARIETIMRQLARWYPVDVNYTGKVADHFTGTISKNVGIGKVFRMLELTGAVHFTTTGNSVTVHP